MISIEEAIKQSDSMLSASKLCGISYETFRRKAKKIGIYTPNQGGKGVKKIKQQNLILMRFYKENFQSIQENI